VPSIYMLVARRHTAFDLEEAELQSEIPELAEAAS